MKNIISGKSKKQSKAPVIVAVVLCAISMFSIAMIYRNSLKKQHETKALIESKDEEDAEESKEEENELNLFLENSEEINLYETESVGLVDGSRKIMNNDNNVNIVVNDAQIANYFSENNILTWPVRGEIIMEYSMDSPIYFNTLQQYGYSDGIIIQAERGMPVYSSADGTVKSVDYTDEHGWTVSVDLGNGYLATYGQLADIQVSEGDNIVTGAMIAEVAVPTKFYSLEGDNVYFSLQKDNGYLDPLEYLE